jgi:hypothetical protein
MAAAVVGISLLIPTSSAAASPSEERPELTVKLLGANGSGCPASEPAPAASADVQANGSVTVKYRNFTVTGGDYKTCVVTVGVTTPAGWTYSIPSIENRAWLELGPGGNTKLATNSWFTGYDWTVRNSDHVAGPISNYWSTTATPATQTWAPCGESVNLTIAETLRVTGLASNTASLLTTTLNPPAWRQC